MPPFLVFECDQCKRKFKNDQALQQHKRDSPPIHTTFKKSKKPYKCASCNGSFRHQSDLNNHTRALHTQALHTQALQTQALQTQALQTQTLQTQAPHTLYPCALCNRSFKHKSALDSHTRALHRKKHKPYRCTLCSRSFVNQTALNNHTEALHYWCQTCSRAFVSISAFNKHNRTSSEHNLQDAKCPFCPSYFRSPSAVAHHIESGCHGITRHQVTHAVKSLDIVPNICIAKRIEGASPTPPATITYYIPSPSSFNGRAYACFLCKKKFRSLSSLSDHLNSAAHDANEFKCPKCKKRFTLISALIQHIESAACRLAGLQQVQDHFQGLIAHFSRLISF